MHVGVTLPCCRCQLHWSSRLCIADTGVRRSFILSYCYRRSHLSLARALPIRMHAGVHTLVPPSPITLELMLVYSRYGRYGCTQEYHALILPSPFTLEPSSCADDTYARRSSHSCAAVADYTGAHARVQPIQIMQEFNALMLPSPITLEPSSCTPTQMYSTLQVLPTTAE